MSAAEARLHQLAFDVLELADAFTGPTAANLNRISMDLFAEFERVVEPHRLVRSLRTSDHCESCLLDWPCPTAQAAQRSPVPNE